MVNESSAGLAQPVGSRVLDQSPVKASCHEEVYAQVRTDTIIYWPNCAPPTRCHWFAPAAQTKGAAAAGGDWAELGGSPETGGDAALAEAGRGPPRGWGSAPPEGRGRGALGRWDPSRPRASAWTAAAASSSRRSQSPSRSRSREPGYAGASLDAEGRAGAWSCSANEPQPQLSQKCPAALPDNGILHGLQRVAS
ncbi:uncharacterized protein LOC113836679 isoform X1 [Cricetulus griseus]|uniref:uncharacterized protein LOC113836679 isoform X1 n=1 Tax=Cricetulus griseus TaxID=10029 RepID=UPI0015C3D9B0|nr:uncharacterized protein LOC113836679 isoform X1 [Cricetulus griseus]